VTSDEQPPAGPDDAVAPDDATAPERPPLSKGKSIALGLVGVAVLVLIFVKVIPQIGSYSDALDSLRSMGLTDVVLIVAAVLLYLAWYPLPFMAATPGLSYWRATQLNQGAFAISNGVPAGGAFGLGVQYAMLASWRVTPNAATAAIGAVSVWSLFVSLGLPLLGVVALALSGTSTAGDYVKYAAIGLAILAVIIVLFALVMRSESMAVRIGRLGDRLVNPVLRRFRREPVALEHTVVDFRHHTVGLVSRRWGAITVTQTGVSLTQGLILLAALWGVEGDGDRTSALAVLGAYAVAQIGIMIPLTPGGLGTVDALMIGILTAAGVSAGDATAATLVWRAASFVPQILIGVLSLVVWSRTAARHLRGRADT